MQIFTLIAFIVTLAAIFNYINHRYIKLPTAIGLMLMAFILSITIIVAGYFFPTITVYAKNILNKIDFNKTLLEGMLSFLLFAGALHIKLDDLKKQKWIIGILATLGIMFSTLMIGTIIYGILGLFNISISYLFCLLFGALISPTDPIAVLGMLKDAKAPKSLETKIAGESLFNDGVGVVVFLVLMSLTTGEHELTLSHIGLLLLQEVIGGILLGLILGYITYRMLKAVDDYQVEILLTLALTMGGYALAMALHLSGPIAIVVAGLLIGNPGRDFAMSDVTLKHLDTFWELVDEILNAILFVLIGLEVLVISFHTNYFFIGLITIPVILSARFISILIPVYILSLFRSFTKGAIKIMTWAGLRGGISVALALSLPVGQERELFLTITYIVVIFSILVQGLTVKRLVVSETKGG